MELHGKVALITGGAGGIGYECADKLLEIGAKVAIADVIDQSCGDKQASLLGEKYGAENVIYLNCNVTSDDEFECAFKKTISKFGSIDILINNAGIFNDKQWKLQTEINVNGVIRGMLLAHRYMGLNNGGQGGVILNMSSVAGLGPSAWFATYSGTKAAVIGLTRSWGLEGNAKHLGIRVMALCPGVTFTKLAENLDKKCLYDHQWQALQSALKKAPTQECSDVSNAVDHVLRHGNSGSVWVINGGHLKEAEFPTF